MFWFFLRSADQVEHAHDNPLDEITLGEFDTTTSVTCDEVPSENHVAPKEMNWEIDEEAEGKREAEAQTEGKRTKKKDVKKDKAMREDKESTMFGSHLVVLSLFVEVFCMFVCVYARLRLKQCVSRVQR